MELILFTTPGDQRLRNIIRSVNCKIQGERKKNWFVGKQKIYNHKNYFWKRQSKFSFK